MGVLEIYDIEFVAGDTYNLTLTYEDVNGDPVDLTGYTLYFQMRRSHQSDDVYFDKFIDISSENAILGVIEFSLTSQETLGFGECWPTTTYVYGMRISNVDETDVETLLIGKINAIKGVIGA